MRAPKRSNENAPPPGPRHIAHVQAVVVGASVTLTYLLPVMGWRAGCKLVVHPSFKDYHTTDGTYPQVSRLSLWVHR